MFSLLLPVTLALLAIYAVLMVWRAWRASHGTRRQRKPATLASLPLVPAALLRGEDRTWVVFAASEDPDARRVAVRLRAAEPDSRVTDVDVTRHPRLAEAFGIHAVPAVLLANRYGQVETRLIGLPAIEQYIDGRVDEAQ
jgi:hypothetical protein